jgi:hypothetical protein
MLVLSFFDFGVYTGSNKIWTGSNTPGSGSVDAFCLSFRLQFSGSVDAFKYTSSYRFRFSSDIQVQSTGSVDRKLSVKIRKKLYASMVFQWTAHSYSDSTYRFSIYPWFLT